MKISSIMVRSVKTVNEDDPVQKAVLTMSKHNIASVLVLKGEKATGIITERDVLQRVISLNKNPKIVICRNIMSKSLKTIDSNSDVIDAIEIMSKYNIKKLIVINKNSNLVGIISVIDIINSGEQIERAALNKLARSFSFYKRRKHTDLT